MNKRVFITATLIVFAVVIFGLPPFSGGPNGDFLKPENEAEFKTEIRRHPNGVYEVSAHTLMPGTTPEMVRWWFADYMQTSEHYKRWHPTAHLWMDWENKAAYWIAAFIITAEDIGFLLFPVMQGGIEFPASIIGPGLWIIGLIFTTIAYRSAA